MKEFIFFLLIAAALPFFLIVINLFFYRCLSKIIKTEKKYQVSVLIPARNEAVMISDTVIAVLKNRDIDFELLVLDDHSTDATAEIVNNLAQNDSRVRLITASPLPAGWCGKQHACLELAKQAKNDFLLFIDADVALQPDAIFKACTLLDTKKSDFLSGIPRQLTLTWGEKLIIPLIHFILLGFLPMFMKRYSSDPAFAAGCGQFILVRKQAYWAIGGHASIYASWHDGLNLPKQLRRSGFKTDLADITTISSCRMYHNFNEVWMGFAKNAIEGMAGKFSIIFWTLVLSAGQLIPFVFLLIAILLADSTLLKMAIVGLICVYGARLILALQFKQSLMSVLLHPIGIILLLSIQWYAWIKARKGGTVSWKGRIKVT